MRKILLVIVAVLLFTPCSSFAEGETDVIIRDSLDKYDLSGWDEFSGEESAREIIEEFAICEPERETNTILSTVTDYFVGGVKNAVKLLIPVIAIALISGLCGAILPDTMSGIRELVGFVLSALSVGSVILVFSSAVSEVSDAVGKMSAFSTAAMPVLSATLIAAGQGVSSGTFSPLMLFLTTTVTAFCENILLPLVLTCGVLAVISNISERIQLKKLYELSRSSVKWTVGVVGVLYAGITTIRGLAAANVDGLGIKTTKYVIDKSLPIAGSFVSGTVDTVWACACAVKSAAGTAFLVILFGVIARTLVSLIATILSLRIASAVCEPVAQDFFPKVLSAIADVMTYLTSVLLVCCAMFMITVGIVFFSIG